MSALRCLPCILHPFPLSHAHFVSEPSQELTVVSIPVHMSQRWCLTVSDGIRWLSDILLGV